MKMGRILFLLCIIAFASLSLAERQSNRPARTVAPVTYKQLKQYYGASLADDAGAGKTLCAVLWGGSPVAQVDLDTFSMENGLPKCTFGVESDDCFRVYRVDATTNTLKIVNPALAALAGFTCVPNPNSTPEQSLDIQSFHAMAPGAQKVYICADYSGDDVIFDAVAFAVNNPLFHCDIISMSFGSVESSEQDVYDPIFCDNQYTTTFLAASGDNATVSYPSSSPCVIAVGGTTVNTLVGSFSATGWDESGGGCSEYSVAPAAQADFPQYAAQGCDGRRSVPDIAADADPNSGVTISVATVPLKVGGTSVASPVVAGLFANWGLPTVTLDMIYGNYFEYQDVTQGETVDGIACTPGLDQVTGRGSIIGRNSKK